MKTPSLIAGIILVAAMTGCSAAAATAWSKANDRQEPFNKQTDNSNRLHTKKTVRVNDMELDDLIQHINKNHARAGHFSHYGKAWTDFYREYQRNGWSIQAKACKMGMSGPLLSIENADAVAAIKILLEKAPGF